MTYLPKFILVLNIYRDISRCSFLKGEQCIQTRSLGSGFLFAFNNLHVAYVCVSQLVDCICVGDMMYVSELVT